MRAEPPMASSRSWHEMSEDCREAVQNLFEFLDHELPDADEDRIRQHIADCEPCLADFDVEDHLKKLVRRSCSDSAPAELHVRIRQQITVLRTTTRHGG